ncbi:hypothetical protein [Paenibacillus riograndensis]|uniref:hypothetical protein n=1 Tax=Paenibacillus riograndensis TaxID=483937 RepID=UPI0012FD92A9|nr:hypothetical protein [Paenibacillus riograndensis]
MTKKMKGCFILSINGYNPNNQYPQHHYPQHLYPQYKYPYQHLSPTAPLEDTDLESINLQQILEFHTKALGEETVEALICAHIEELIRSKGLPRGNRGDYKCAADIYDNYSRIKLTVVVVNAHKPCDRCPYAYSLTSTLNADTSLTNPNPADFNFCIKTPGNSQICIDGAEILAIIAEAL